MIEVKAAAGFRRTGRLLQRLLDAYRLPSEPRSVVSWGLYLAEEYDHVLNGNAGALNKMEQARVLSEAGLGVSFFPPSESSLAAVPLIGRRASHTGGTDIIPVWDVHAGRQLLGSVDYFTKYQPSIAEHRIWIYRRQHLGSYEKWLPDPRAAKGFGRNYDNGWRFKLVEAGRLNRRAIDFAAQSVTKLSLDFGAVDVLVMPEGYPVVLEVNCAPGIESEDRQVIRALARKIRRWHELDFPQRRGS